MTTTTTTTITRAAATPRELLGLPPSGPLTSDQIRSAWRAAVRAVPADIRAEEDEQQARDRALQAIHRARALLEGPEIDEADEATLADEYQQRVLAFVAGLEGEAHRSYARVDLADEDAVPTVPRRGHRTADWRPLNALIDLEARAEDVRWVSGFFVLQGRAWVVLELMDGQYRALVFWGSRAATPKPKKKAPPRPGAATATTTAKPTKTVTPKTAALPASPPKTAAPPPRSRPADPPPPTTTATKAERRAYYDRLGGWDRGDIVDTLRTFGRAA